MIPHPAGAAATATTRPLTRSVLALDVGGTTVKVAVVDDAGSTVNELRRPTRDGSTPPLDTILDVVRGTLEDCERGNIDVTAIGIAVPGIIDAPSGTILQAANLGWRKLPLRDLLHEQTGLPTALVNDAHAAALAEHRRGAAIGIDDFIIVPLGTGVGGAVVSHGRLVTGSRGAAGELGHVIVVPDGEPCACGRRGCVEAYASGPSIARRYHAASGTALSTAQVADRAGSDPLAAQVWHEAVEALAAALAGMIAATDPELVVLAGGVAQAGSVLVAPLQEALRERLGPEHAPLVASSSLGTDTSRIGAALAAFDAFDALASSAPSPSRSRGSAQAPLPRRD